MKNLFITISILILGHTLVFSQADTSFVFYNDYEDPCFVNSFSEINQLSDTTFILLEESQCDEEMRASLSLFTDNFEKVETVHSNINSNYRDWEEPTYFSFLKSDSVFLCGYHHPDTSLAIEQYNLDLQLEFTKTIAIPEYPNLVISDFTKTSNHFFVCGYFEVEDREAIFLKLDAKTYEVVFQLSGSQVFSNTSNYFRKMMVKNDVAFILSDGFLQESENNSSIMRVDQSNSLSIIHEWDFPSPFLTSFTFLDTSEYIYNARNHDLSFPNWWAQYYENLETGANWEAEDNSPGDFTSITLSGFSETYDGNIITYGIKENFFNPDNVTFPNLFNVINFATAYLSKLDRETGERLWEYQYLSYNNIGEVEQSIILDAIELKDSSLVLVGYSERDIPNDPLEDQYYAGMILKLPSNGCFNYNCEDLLSFTSATKDIIASNNGTINLDVFPNPSPDYIDIKGIDLLQINDFKYQLYTSDGQLVQASNLSITDQGRIDTSLLKPGTYLIQIIDTKQRRSTFAKFIKI